MYQDVCQHGLISILFTVGNKPLLNWKVSNKDGILKRHTDEIINSLVLDFRAPSISNNFIECPKDPTESLSIYMKYFVMIVRNIKHALNFEIQILDVDGFKRILRVSNVRTKVLIHPMATNLPLWLYPNWNTVVLDLEKLTKNSYGISYFLTQRVKINANFTVRRMFFSDRPYKDSELPKEYKANITPNIQKPLVL